MGLMKNKNTTTHKTFDSGDAIQKVLMVIMLFWFAVFLVMPMLMMFGQIFTDDLGNWVGLGNFREYFSNPLLFSSIGHSLFISVITATLSTVIGLLYAYGITRTST